MAYATLAGIRQWLEQVPETAEQLITVSGAAGGSFTLSYAGEGGDEVTDPIPWAAAAPTVRAALLALPSIAAHAAPHGEPIVRVRGRRGGPWRVTFGPALGDDAELLVASAAGLAPAPGATPAVVVAPTYDALLQQCLDDATGLIDPILQPIRFLGYTAPEARLVPGVGGDTLYLPPHQPGSVSAVALGGAAVSGWSALPSEPDLPIEHLYRPAGWAHTAPSRTWDDVLRRAPLGWPYTRDDLAFVDGVHGGYAVTARWGWGDPPQAVVELCKELAVNIWRGRDRGMFTEVIGAEGGAMLRYTGALNKSQQVILQGVKDRLWTVAL